MTTKTNDPVAVEQAFVPDEALEGARRATGNASSGKHPNQQVEHGTVLRCVKPREQPLKTSTCIGRRLVNSWNGLPRVGINDDDHSPSASRI